MEDELVVFKKKIASRFENREIARDFEFPRIGSSFHQKLHNKYNFIEAQEQAARMHDHHAQRVQSQDREPKKNPER